MKLLYDAWLIFLKDLKQEYKTRYALNAILLFAIVTLVAVSFSIGTFTAAPEIKAALLWIILFFSAMSGLSHIFIREEERHTSDTLKLVTQPAGIFIGKLIFNFLLFLFIELITIPLFFAVMNFEVSGIRLFLMVVILGTLGLSAGATIVAAIISKASARGALFTVLSFPILLPVLVAGISGTKISILETDIAAAAAELQMLFAYSVVIITAALMLFDFVWKD